MVDVEPAAGRDGAVESRTHGCGDHGRPPGPWRGRRGKVGKEIHE